MKRKAIWGNIGVGVVVLGVLFSNPCFNSAMESTPLSKANTANLIEEEKETFMTRAQVAEIMGEIFRPTPEEYILARDVASNRTYSKAMKTAVSMGLYMDDVLMRPSDAITLQELYTALFRVFEPQAPKDPLAILDKFADHEKVQEWAVNGVAAMMQVFPTATINNKINPDRSVTKQEFSQMLKALATTVITTPGEVIVPATPGNVIVSCPGVTLKNQTIFGDLILTEGIGTGYVKLENVVITGKILNRAGEKAIFCGT